MSAGKRAARFCGDVLISALSMNAAMDITGRDADFLAQIVIALAINVPASFLPTVGKREGTKQ